MSDNVKSKKKIVIDFMCSLMYTTTVEQRRSSYDVGVGIVAEPEHLLVYAFGIFPTVL